MPGRHMNKLIRILRDLGVIPVRIEAGPENDAKHIPDIYLFNSREVRLRLAAGIIDADGSYNPVTNSFLIIQSLDWHEDLLNDVALLFRSLGFVTNRQSWHRGSFRYGVLNIGGERLHEIPSLLLRKRAPAEARLKTGLQGFGFEARATVETARIEIDVSNDKRFIRDDLVLLCAGAGPVSLARYIRLLTQRDPLLATLDLRHRRKKASASTDGSFLATFKVGMRLGS